MIDTYKILNDKYDPAVSKNLIKLSTINTTRDHPLKLEKQYARLNIRKFSFTHRIVNVWNSLPEHVITAPSIKSFEKRLDKFWENQALKFNYLERVATEGSRFRAIYSQKTTSDADQDVTREVT